MTERRAFLQSLRGVEAELSLPIPTRTRILRELEYDLEQFSARLVADGCPPEEARRRAEETLVPAGPSIAALEAVNQPAYRAATRAIDPRRLQLLERAVLVLLTAGVVVAQTLTLLSADLLSDRSPFLAPVMVAGALGWFVALWTGFDVWVKGLHEAARDRLPVLLAIAAAIIACAAVGVVADFYVLASGLERSSDGAAALVVAWAIRDCVLVAIAILLVLTLCLSWFVLRQWLLLAQGEHLAFLGVFNSASSNRRV